MRFDASEATFAVSVRACEFWIETWMSAASAFGSQQPLVVAIAGPISGGMAPIVNALVHCGLEVSTGVSPRVAKHGRRHSVAQGTLFDKHRQIEGGSPDAS